MVRHTLNIMQCHIGRFLKYAYPFFNMHERIKLFWVSKKWNSESFNWRDSSVVTPQKLKFSFKNFFSKWDQIRRKLRIWSHILMENFTFCAVSHVNMQHYIKYCVGVFRTLSRTWWLSFFAKIVMTFSR